MYLYDEKYQNYREIDKIGQKFLNYIFEICSKSI